MGGGDGRQLTGKLLHFHFVKQQNFPIALSPLPLSLSSLSTVPPTDILIKSLNERYSLCICWVLLLLLILLLLLFVHVARHMRLLRLPPVTLCPIQSSNSSNLPLAPFADCRLEKYQRISGQSSAQVKREKKREREGRRGRGSWHPNV